jgi:hypothetical protein
MRELQERYPRPDAAGILERRTHHGRHDEDKLTPRSPARVTVRRATNWTDSKAAAIDGHRNLAAADATTPATPPKSCPYWASPEHRDGF